VGDNPVPTKDCTETGTAEQCGFIAASHGHFVNIGQHLQEVSMHNCLLKTVHVSKIVMDCDMFISLPKYRVHELTVMSLAIKNQFGIVPGNIKPSIHARYPKIHDFCRTLLEIYAIREPDLIIVDVLSSVDARGRKFYPKILVSGKNGHAIDYVCARIANIDPWRIPTLRIARDMGLFDPSETVIKGDLPVLHGFRSPVVFPFRIPIVEFFGQMLYQLWLKRRPYIILKHCTKCAYCEEVCPVQAIQAQKIDHNSCISCFCCFEVCPHNAIKTRVKW
jgi:NAD-dependent dihydropyrimidine dehydrogenase PreA subunit